MVRSHGTLLALELREQGPLGLIVIVSGVLILLGLRAASNAEPGELAAQVPILAWGLTALLLVFPAAEILSRDNASGLARTLAKAPVGRLRLVLPRLLVLAVLAVVLHATLTALEPPRATSLEVQVLAGLHVALVVAIALTGAVLRHGIAAAVVGTLLYVGGFAALSWLAQLDALAPSATAAVKLWAWHMRASITLPMVAAPGVAALALAFVVRGAGARRFSRRFAAAALGAFVFLAPSASRAALETVPHVRVPFDDPYASFDDIVPTADGSAVYVRLSRGTNSDGSPSWSSAWLIDPSTGSHRRLTSWLEEDPRAEGLSNPLTGCVELEEGLLEARLRLASGEAAERFRFRHYGWPIRAGGSGTFVYVDEGYQLRAISLADGRMRVFPAVRGLEATFAVNVSPDSRWVALSDWNIIPPITSRWEARPRVRLVDLASGTVVHDVQGSFHSWRHDRDPLLVIAPTPGPLKSMGPTYCRVGPGRAAPLPVSGKMSLIELDGTAYLGLESSRRANDTLHLVGVDGSIVRTLR